MILNRIPSADHASNFAAGPLDEFTILFHPWLSYLEPRRLHLVRPYHVREPVPPQELVQRRLGEHVSRAPPADAENPIAL